MLNLIKKRSVSLRKPNRLAGGISVGGMEGIHFFLNPNKMLTVNFHQRVGGGCWDGRYPLHISIFTAYECDRHSSKEGRTLLYKEMYQ